MHTTTGYHTKQNKSEIIPYDVIYMWNLKYDTDEPIYETELKSLLMKVKEESEKAGSKLNVQKMKIMASGPFTSWQRDG